MTGVRGEHSSGIPWEKSAGRLGVLELTSAKVTWMPARQQRFRSPSHWNCIWFGESVRGIQSGVAMMDCDGVQG